MIGQPGFIGMDGGMANESEIHTLWTSMGGRPVLPGE